MVTLTKPPQQKFAEGIDLATQHHLFSGEKRRGHFGASGAGSDCARQAWYAFRWIGQEKHSGRIKRLFTRGHDEEFRFAKWLRMAGCEVQDYSQRLVVRLGDREEQVRYECQPWDKPIGTFYKDVSMDEHHIKLATVGGTGPSQWNFRVDFDRVIHTNDPANFVTSPHTGELVEVEHAGHYSGSSDGRIRGAWINECWPELAARGWGLLEEKTHNDRSFKLVKKEGVKKSKFLHYIQMQQYMKAFGLKWALYCAVNKNDDELFFEVVMYDEVSADQYFDRAMQIISLPSAPRRVKEDPSWYACKWCDFSELCHHGNQVQKRNCRSCVFSAPVAGGKWYCGKFEQELPDDFIPSGCQKWEPVQ